MMKLYYIHADYCHYLRQFDDRIPYNEGMKQRPFIGIVITIHAVDFFAPLTSPKAKHRNMNHQMDFVKIDHGVLGAINLNNMIPVQKGLYTEMPFHEHTSDEKEVAYQQLLMKQLKWCNQHQKEIKASAYRLYKSVNLRTAPKTVEKRCCRFYQDMLLMQEYCMRNHIDTTKLIQDIEKEKNWLAALGYRADRYVIYVPS